MMSTSCFNEADVRPLNNYAVPSEKKALFQRRVVFS